MAKVRISGGNYAQVDDEDLHLMINIDWSENRSKQSYTSYAHARINGVPTYMHRHILGLKPGDKQYVDHINGDGLDNRRFNLRIVNQSINGLNSRNRDKQVSKYYGVFKQKERKHFRAVIFDEQLGRVYLGSYLDEIEAAKAYDSYVRIFKPKDHPVNFPQEVTEDKDSK